MALLYDRVETETETVITYKYQPILYVGLILFAILSTTDFELISSAIFNILFLAFLIFWIINLLPSYKETREAMKKGSVQVSGSKFSLKNPMTIKIRK